MLKRFVPQNYPSRDPQLILPKLFRKYGNFRDGEEPWKKYGRPNDWNIDLVPKLLMSNGDLTNILISTNVTRYLEFKQIAGSFVQKGKEKDVTIAKVPAKQEEAWDSPLMGWFEKYRAGKFLKWCLNLKEDDPSTHRGLFIRPLGIILFLTLVQD